MATHLIVIFIHVYKVSVLVVIMSHDLKTEDMVGYEISYVINATIGILRGKELVHCWKLGRIIFFPIPLRSNPLVVNEKSPHQIPNPV